MPHAPTTANETIYRQRLRRRWTRVAPMLTALWALAAPASAQNRPAIFTPEDAVVTGFSGAVPPVQIAPGTDPGDLTFIDKDGASLRIVDLGGMGGPPHAEVVGAPKPFTVKASTIGQVFGVALDDASPPNIYAAAASVYGLPIAAPGKGGGIEHIRTGAAGASFMPGLWGTGGGPGSIWKIDGTSGAVSLFATVMTGSRGNSGAALGGLAYDPDSKSIYVADRESGFVHRYGLDGRSRGLFNHGVTGRAAQGLTPVRWTERTGVDVTAPQFDSTDPATWNYAPAERRVFGLAVHQHRLYYAVAAGLQVWSVGLKSDGGLEDDALIELIAPAAAGPTEISRIAFDEQGRMFLAERAAPTGAFNFEALAVPGIGRVLRYALAGSSPDGRRIWQREPSDYAIGFPSRMTNSNGGVAIGFSYLSNGDLDRSACGGFVWSTGEILRRAQDPALATELARSGPLNVAGLQGNASWLAKPNNIPPLRSYYVEFDDRMSDSAARGHLGDIAIRLTCTPARPEIFSPLGGEPRPSRPGFPRPPRGRTPPPGKPPPPPPGPNCPPGELHRIGERGGEAGCVPQCSRPDVQVGGRCCAPGTLAAGGGCSNASCPAGQTAIANGNYCCDSARVYTAANGAPACCAGAVINGQCQNVPVPPGHPNCAPGSTDPQCCPSGYVSTGTTCCLAGSLTSNGVCCPAGEVPFGLNRSQCIPIFHIPQGPQCCGKGLIPAGQGQCCPPANLSSLGICCTAPVNPADRSKCPVEIQVVPQCASGYTRMADGSCCNDRFLSGDGRSCGVRQRPCPPGEYRVYGGACETVVPSPSCPPGELRDDRGGCAAPPLSPQPSPPRAACPMGETRDVDGRCSPPRPAECGAEQIRDREGRCINRAPPPERPGLPPPPRVAPRPIPPPVAVRPGRPPPPPPQRGPPGREEEPRR